MNSRTRFIETMRFGAPDRAPLFEEGVRQPVLDEWRAQGMPRRASLDDLFCFDRREELAPDLDPRPAFETWPSTIGELSELRRRLDPADPARLPARWKAQVRAWRQRGRVVMLRVHEGFFLTMGVYGWRRFSEVNYLVADDPEFVRQAMRIHGEFAARVVGQVLGEAPVDAAVFSEPIGGNHGPLISPKAYAELVLPAYQPIFETLARHGVETIILRTYANTRVLLPAALERGVNCLWAVEARAEAMDYLELRQVFGRQLRLIGGLNVAALRQDQEAIRREVMRKAPILLAQGGYVPLADGRVREGVPYENYRYYRGLIESLSGSR